MIFVLSQYSPRKLRKLSKVGNLQTVHAVVLNSNTSTCTLARIWWKLRKSSAWIIRQSVAENYNTSRLVIWYISHFDSDKRVRQAAKNNNYEYKEITKKKNRVQKI